MKKFSSLLAVMLVALAGCATPSHEPRNLEQLKADIRSYVKSGDYDRDIAAVAARAQTWVEQRVAQRKAPSTGSKQAGEKLTMIIDLDETLFSNWPFMLDEDLGGSDAAWEAWMGSGKDAAIEPVRELYRVVRRLGVDVVFLTGRRARIHAGTEKNLRDIDCTDYVALICRPDDSKGTAAAYKAAERQRLTAEGRVIIASIGDQESDLSGGFAERTFKLPNPFYIDL